LEPRARKGHGGQGQALSLRLCDAVSMLRASWPRRCSRMAMAAAAPSPAALTSCLVLPARTSPAAKMPAVLVWKSRPVRGTIIKRVIGLRSRWLFSQHESFSPTLAKQELYRLVFKVGIFVWR